MVRVCHGKLYPQHQYLGSGERSATSRSSSDATISPVWFAPSSGAFSNADKNSAMPFGFCVFSTRNRPRTLIGLRFRSWVSAICGIRDCNTGNAIKSRLFKAS